MRLSLFDLDNTLLAGDSDFEWAQFLIEKGVLDKEVYEASNQQFFEQYKAGTLDIHEFLDFQLKPLSRHPRKVLNDWHREYMRTHIMPIITQKARDLVASHRDDARAIIRQAIAELHPTCRQAFVMHRFGGATYGQIAQRLELSVSMIEKHVSHALAHLKTRLDTANAAGRLRKAGP